jgi:glycosyltransferase involved in cell wall biosynthesis
MVGTLEPRKGHSLAIDAFERLWASGSDIRLQIIGKNGWMIDDLIERIRSHPQFGTRLLLNLTADDAELQRAYVGAKLVLSASFVEGFGLPLIEAAALGKSLIVSDIPSSREVCGDNAIYFHAGDPNDLFAKLERWARTGEQPRAPNHLSWAQSAAQIAEQLTRISSSQWSGNHSRVRSKHILQPDGGLDSPVEKPVDRTAPRDNNG